MAVNVAVGSGVGFEFSDTVAGYVTGLGYFCGTLYWLSFVMAQYGDLPMVVAGLLAFGLAAWLSVFVGLFASLTG